MLRVAFLLIASFVKVGLAAPVTMDSARSPNGKLEVALIRTTKPCGQQKTEIALGNVAKGKVFDTIELLDHDDFPVKALWSPDGKNVALNILTGWFIVYPISEERGFGNVLHDAFSPETRKLYESIQAKVPPNKGQPQIERWIDASTLSVVDLVAQVRCRYSIQERELMITAAEPLHAK